MREFLGSIGATVAVMVIAAWWRRRQHRAAIARIEWEIAQAGARRIHGMDKADHELAARTQQKRAAIDSEIRAQRKQLENPQIVKPADHVTEFKRRVS